MIRTRACAAIAVLVVATSAAADPESPRTPPAPENTSAACRDGIDNDQDGYVDCRDQDCFEFVFCAPQAAPSGAYPPPPPVAAPTVVAPPPPAPAPEAAPDVPAAPVPPPTVPPPPVPTPTIQPAPVAPPTVLPSPLPSMPSVVVSSRPPRNGKTQLIAGAVLLPLGIALAAGSAPLWFDGLDSDHTALNHFQSFHDGTMLGVGAGLTVIGTGLVAAGAALIGVGGSRLAAERRGGAR